MQCDVLISNEIGKWIRVKGTVADTFQHGQTGQVILRTPSDDTVSCFVADKSKPNLGALSSGDNINTTGKIDGVTFGALMLKECELP